jgi:hypothetical protein
MPLNIITPLSNDHLYSVDVSPVYYAKCTQDYALLTPLSSSSPTFRILLHLSVRDTCQSLECPYATSVSSI